ncbi:MAG: chorismate synthase [Chitinophagales bacterium]|jgi:chorismate synthase|nr:chorismate synthase [Chitinophagales bacterium]
MSHQFGRLLQLTTYGESHGARIGGILTGMPPGINLDTNLIQEKVNRRKASQNLFSTPRNESDIVVYHSGIYQGKTTGMPIAFSVENKTKKSEDYDNLKDIYRPSHADFTYHQKYKNYDYRGSGRASARETLNWVIGGAIAAHLIPKIQIFPYVSQIGHFSLLENELEDITNAFDYPLHFPNLRKGEEVMTYLSEIQAQKDTLGGAISCIINNLPVGLGEPVFYKLQSALAAAMMGINTAKGFLLENAIQTSQSRGSQVNDEFDEDFKTKTNHSAGILGGISNGMPIGFTVYFKPISSIGKPQNTVTHEGLSTQIEIGGRHDVCAVPRAVAVVQGLTELVLADLWLLDRLHNTKIY